jgi:hypothetical protein
MAIRKRQPSDADRLVLEAHEAELMRSHRADSHPDTRAEAVHVEAEDGIELHVCAECGSDLVYPLDWAPAAERRWSVVRRCPDCEWRGQGVYGQDAVDRFDEHLDAGSQAIMDDLTMLTHANMSDEIERFVGAIDADLILPEDF